MIPHIDSLTPNHGRFHDEILIQGSGFRPNDTYVRAVMFKFTGNGVTLSADFSHVVAGGEIRDDQLIATVPLPWAGGARVWVENIDIVPPDPHAPHPGELGPGELPEIPEPQYHVYRSNVVPFLVECLGPDMDHVTEATMPDGVRTVIEDGILELQALVGGRFPIAVEDISHEDDCLGYKTTDIKATVELDSVETAWSADGLLWTITLTASLRATAKVDVKNPATLCQWSHVPPLNAGGGGHRWDFTVSACTSPCDASTRTMDRTFWLFYVSSRFHMGSMIFAGIPSWADGGLRDDVKEGIRAASLGPHSPILSVIQILCELAYRTHLGGECPPLSLLDVCAAAEAVSSSAEHQKVLRPLRAFRSSVLEASAAGRTLSQLWSLVSPDLVRVMRRDPVVWGEAAFLLRELSGALDDSGRGRRVPLTAARYERVRKLFERSRARLSPITVIAAEAVLDRLDAFVGVPRDEMRAVLARWRAPAVVVRMIQFLTTARGGGRPRGSRPSQKRNR